MTNNKLLKSSVGIIILSVVIIMIANIMLKVDKPVFLENYCEYPLSYYKDPSYNGSYTRSLATVENILKTNPSDIIIDVHRDAVGSRSDYAPTVKIGDTDEAAQIMFVIRNK